ncbi:hypothetical protein HY409_03280, partial [Candidatus Gottesmanbacteria bacterium]|nr:hypothetical protein [Candidatus Gottesmanbacteria bacterium]
AFHISVRVEEVNTLPDATQFCLEIALGTSIDEILKHEKDLALALVSPTGKVKIQASIPGTCWVGVLLPHDKKTEDPKKLKAHYYQAISTAQKRGISLNIKHAIGNLVYELGFRIVGFGARMRIN